VIAAAHQAATGAAVAVRTPTGASGARAFIPQKTKNDVRERWLESPLSGSFGAVSPTSLIAGGT
jgi:hypothetical protein